MSADFIKKKKKLYTEYEMLFDEFFFFFSTKLHKYVLFRDITDINIGN